MGLSNLTFVSHTLRCMCRALPSVSTMVSYKLPGYHAPEKFYSPSDVSFYVPCQWFSKWCIMMGLNLRTLNCVSPICKGYLQRLGIHLHSTQKGVNSVIWSRNVYSNRQAPSKDFATAFAVQESIRFTFSGSCYNTSEGLVFLETGKNGQLINVQDYIEYNSQASTSVALETGLFIGSFHTEQATFLFASKLVSCAVSVVHQCDSQCVLAEQDTTSRIERW
ncbi:hypothetical protein EMCRGX_G006701 [Ephydatia muelleri]